MINSFLSNFILFGYSHYNNINININTKYITYCLSRNE